LRGIQGGAPRLAPDSEMTRKPHTWLPTAAARGVEEDVSTRLNMKNLPGRGVQTRPQIRPLSGGEIEGKSKPDETEEQKKVSWDFWKSSLKNETLRSADVAEKKRKTPIYYRGQEGWDHDGRL